MSKRKDILWRIYILYFGVVVIALAIVWKIFTIQYIQGEYWREKAQLLSTDTFLVKANRGNILAGDGSYLAITVPAYDLRMDPLAGAIKDEIWSENIDSLAICLSNTFKDRTVSEYKSRLQKARKDKNRYLLIKSNVSRSQLKQVRAFPIFRLGRYKGGLIEIEKTLRVKPYGNLAARTIGKEEGESQGLGLEIAYDEFLKGEEGLRLMEKLSGGTWRPVDHENTIDPVDGYDIITTIDPKLQDVAESELERQLAMHGAGHGCVVLMEVKTGDIKAIANLKKNDDGNYYESYNYAIGECVDPGSTMKLATMLSLVEDGYVDTSDLVETGNGVISLYGHTLKDSHHGGYGTVTIKRAFEVSSNVGMAKLVLKYYNNDAQKFVDHLKKFHLNQKLGIEIPGEGEPLVRNKGDKGWSGLSLPMMAIGYEVLVSPMQILTLYNAVANNGKMMKPRFVTEIRNRTQVVKKNEPVVLEENIASDKTIRICQSLLEGVVLNGTAKNLRNPVYRIAGKTGTAQIANNNLGYHSAGTTTYRASFCGYFPADNPKYTCIVVVNAPSNSVYTGNIVAGPIFKAVADKVYTYAFDINQKYYEQERRTMTARVPYCKKGYADDLLYTLNAIGVNMNGEENSGTWINTTAGSQDVSVKTIAVNRQLMPDVRGMGARDAMYVLEKAGIRNITVTGKGTVREQSVAPGSSLKGVENITLVLS